jgi:hypothetical protein
VIGARVNAMGYAATCEQDAWSMFGNPAGIAATSQAQSFFTYEAMPSFPGFNRMAAGIVLPSKLGVAGAGVYRFGDDLYNEQILSAGFANTMGVASLGIRGNIVQYNVEGFGTKRLLTVNVGGLVQFTPWLWVGAFIVNVNQPKIESGQHVPTRLYVGIAARPSNHCFITAEVEKDLDMKALLKAGMEYEVHRKILIRTGVNLFPGAGYVGVGFKPTWFSLDYAFSFIPNVGSKHQASVAYQFNERKK